MLIQHRPVVRKIEVAKRSGDVGICSIACQALEGVVQLVESEFRVVRHSIVFLALFLGELGRGVNQCTVGGFLPPSTEYAKAKDVLWGMHSPQKMQREARYTWSSHALPTPTQKSDRCFKFARGHQKGLSGGQHLQYSPPCKVR